MRMESIRMGAQHLEVDAGTTTIFVTTEPVLEVAVSVLNSIANKERDHSWAIGDQAMNKVDSGKTLAKTRGCSA